TRKLSGPPRAATHDLHDAPRQMVRRRGLEAPYLATRLFVRPRNSGVFQLVLDHEGTGFELLAELFNRRLKVCRSCCNSLHECPLRSEKLGCECPRSLLVP